MKKEKIGRNDKCPCGSGKKFKSCHGVINPNLRYFDFFCNEGKTNAVLDTMRPISTKVNGQRFIAAGKRIYQSSKWITFHDFLFDHIKICFGDEWWKKEIKKSDDTQHPIITWYRATAQYLERCQEESSDVVYNAIATGPAASILSISYELYILEKYIKLQSTLLNRLKDLRQFQGARYELYVTSIFIKSGFEITFEDESDRSQSHCEFCAKNLKTNRKYSVEAKSRHRSGFLGLPGEQKDVDSIKLRIGTLLNNALHKKADAERVIFIDVNMPPEEEQAFKLSWFIAADSIIKDVEKNTDAKSIVFLTNIPNHYVGDKIQEPAKNYLMTAINIPEFLQPDTNIAINNHREIFEIWSVINKYNKVPYEFYE